MAKPFLCGLIAFVGYGVALVGALGATNSGAPQSLSEETLIPLGLFIGGIASAVMATWWLARDRNKLDARAARQEEHRRVTEGRLSAIEHDIDKLKDVAHSG